MTDVQDPGPVAPDLTTPERDGWPTWLRRTFTTLVFLAALGALVVMTHRGQHGEAGPANDVAVVQRIPAPGARVLAQSEVGAQLKPGYDGRVSINGIEVPEDQMAGALDPGSGTARQYGVRPNNKEQVLFLPGPGKVFEKLPTGEDEIAIRLWRIVDGQRKARTISWRITVS